MSGLYALLLFQAGWFAYRLKEHVVRARRSGKPILPSRGDRQSTIPKVTEVP